jgi:hypothetical protein
LHARTGKTRWCFPGRDGTDHIDVKSVSKQIGDRQHQFKQCKALANRRNDNSLVLSNGGNGRGGACAAATAGWQLRSGPATPGARRRHERSGYGALYGDHFALRFA